MGNKFIVPDEFMIPVGAKYTKETGKCADSWSDSQLAAMRAELPPQYHAVPTDVLGMRWRNIRKKGTPGYRVDGKGPAKKSRIVLKQVSQEYLDYLETEDWKNRRTAWLEEWGYRCSFCNIPNSQTTLDIHHRTYARLGSEHMTDCVVLCRKCHNIFHKDLKVCKP